MFDTLGIPAAKIALIREFFLPVKPHGAKWAGPDTHTTADAVIRIDFDSTGVLIANKSALLGTGRCAGCSAALLADIGIIEKSLETMLTLMRDLAGLISSK
ncbi:MAG: hypothetical protein PVH37_22825 [Desulfobacterales bacterium]|jgi:hypothetical protein